MAKFCSKCGMKLNEQTGKCPNCDEKTKMDTASSDSNISINGNPKEDQNIKKTNGEQEVKKESKTSARFFCRKRMVSGYEWLVVP